MRILLFVSFQLLCAAAAFSSPLRGANDQNGIAIQEIRGSLENVRHEVGNHELEIRTFEEKLQNLDTIIESVRDQLADSSKLQKELLKGSSSSLESKILALETVSKNLVADVKQFKTHSTEITEILTQYKQKISELEKIIEQQSRSIGHLQNAMKTLTEAFQDKDTATTKAPLSGSTYRVQTGDSLEKIARANGTTVQVIKELNGLSNDRIVVGKVLQIPEK